MNQKTCAMALNQPMATSSQVEETKLFAPSLSVVAGANVKPNSSQTTEPQNGPISITGRIDVSF